MSAGARRALLVAAILWVSAGEGMAFEIAPGPSVVPTHFEVTSFASGLDFPFGMTLLQDGSLLVGVNPTAGSYFAAQGALHRFVDSDDDGVADAPGSALHTGLPGFVTSLRRADTLVFVAIGGPRIVILRQGAGPADPLVFVDEIVVQFGAAWDHSTLSLAVRPQSGSPGHYELYFNLGSQANDVDSTLDVTLSGLVSATVAPDAIHRVILDDTGPSLSGAAPEQIASGLRNAFGIAFDPENGDLVFQDNGIDGTPDANEPESADELNRIAASDIGGAVEHFGFSTHYVQYRTGTVVGSGGLLPVVAFQPVPMPDGAESEGAVDVVFAPPLFPAGLRGGVFVGFHGRFSSAGLANEENAVVFADLAGGSHHHFIGNDQPDLGHPNTLAATADRLYLADMTSATGLDTPGSGTVYRIRYAPPPVPAASPAAAIALAVLLLLSGLWAVRRRTGRFATRQAGASAMNR